ncbi:hypothetical protein D3P06_18470 [Paracoccus aestuarii]|uniref:Transposase IS116/IS110/IS902 C-terminal domain-containing protein n=1 Tax=Paracoccus aestuarii TaxID=453842 RepID=A0A418ZPI7_9RHOB|nr:transposase [Paracoccus aestuarii]RJK94698.1 hypothetical protein D3P06_18470 [Paracoccus aestuarii]
MWVLLEELAIIEGRIKAVTGKVEPYASQHDAVSRLVTIPGIRAIGATAIVAAAGDGRQFRKARNLAAWLAPVPAEHSPGRAERFTTSALPSCICRRMRHPGAKATGEAPKRA